MANAYKSRWVDYVIFGLSLFLIFCLVFESYIELPRLVAWLGHWHPLVLHFPIVLLLISVFLGLTGKKIPKLLLTSAVIFALSTAISGFFLGKEAGSKGDLLFWHQWLGGGLALLATIWYWLDGIQFQNKILTKMLQLAVVGLVFFTGHYGGMLTHGEDFLALPVEKRDEKIPENPLIYKDVVGRILDAKCVSCHNPNKKKGELLMTSLDGLLAGGEVGNTIIPQNPEDSELIKRIHLPLEDEDHMPPEGKKPLEANEIQILERWIALGASDTLRLEHLPTSESLVRLVNGLMEPDLAKKWLKLPKVADTTIARLSSDYMTIRRVAGGVHAVSINLYTSPTYSAKQLATLKDISENIVQMDVSGISIGQEEMNLIASFSNLESLEIDQTPVSDVEIDTLKVLSELKILKIFSTAISDKSIPVFQKLKGLQHLYVWDTRISDNALNELVNSNPDLRIDSGVDEELKKTFFAQDSISKN